MFLSLFKIFQTYIHTRYFPGSGCGYGYSPNTRPVPNLTNITRVRDLHQTQFDLNTWVSYSIQTQLDLSYSGGCN